MKKILLIAISTILFAQTDVNNKLVDGLERASAPYQRDACKMAKAEARKNYDVKDINVGCTCEKSDAREWMCFVRFKHLPKEN